MAKIETLVPDILSLFATDRLPISEPSVSDFADKLSKKIATRVTEERARPTLRLSNLGSRCNRQLWYKINRSEQAEALRPEVRVKFLFGDILEEMLLFLAREAGHDVQGEQDELNLNGVIGHRDAVIDGVVVDVKSASSRSFEKFAAGLGPDMDDFGYLTQLDTYLHASDDVADTSRGAFFVIDKQLGKICLDFHNKSKVDYKSVVERKQAMMAKSEPPPRAFQAEPDGKSGNMKLPTACSYCAFKKTCWPGVRTFAYANGPRYLTQVKKTPDVPEVL